MRSPRAWAEGRCCYLDLVAEDTEHSQGKADSSQGVVCICPCPALYKVFSNKAVFRIERMVFVILIGSPKMRCIGGMAISC